MDIDSYWDWRIKSTKKYRWNSFSQLMKQRSSKIGACLICTFLFGLDLFMTYRWWWSHKCKNLSSLQIKLRGEREETYVLKLKMHRKKNRWIITYYPVSKKVIESDQKKEPITSNFSFFLKKILMFLHLEDRHQ